MIRRWRSRTRTGAAAPAPDESQPGHLAAIRARLRPDWHLIEAGCGTGEGAVALAPHVAHVHAFDISGERLAAATSRAAQAGHANITFEQAAFDDIAAQTRCDALVMFSLHLLPDWQAAVARAHALVRPGGIFACHAACIGDYPVAARSVLARLARSRGEPPPRFFTAASLRTALESHGFVIEEWERPGRLTPVFALARRPA